MDVCILTYLCCASVAKSVLAIYGVWIHNDPIHAYELTKKVKIYFGWLIQTGSLGSVYIISLGITAIFLMA